MGYIALAVLLGAAALAAWLTSRRLLAERGELRRVRALFSRYVPVQVVDELLARKDPRLFEAREYYATIVSCRIRGFALIAERVSPEETLRYLNEFYTLVGGAVERHHGMIESLRGDTVTAIFGVLVEEKFQEERALRAALDVMRLSDAIDERRRTQGRKALGVSVGVNSGKVVAGDTGYQLRRDFAIVGNPAHVAERLQGAAEELNATIVASASTYEAVRELFVGIPTSSIPLRGLKRLQNAYIVRGLTKRAAEDDLLVLPKERYFKQTVVRPDETLYQPEPAPAEYMAPSTFQSGRFDARTAPAPREETYRFSAFDDDRPAMPAPPPLSGTYEDDEGPPVPLPP
ncbi:MAG TPA: adenylate/guanylate cyclase domain-containing protein [Candidatus Baltobacteraceae bacterium]|jgi:class 3 adenylate cyclase